MPIDDFKQGAGFLADAYGPHVVGGQLGAHEIKVGVSGEKIITLVQLLGNGGRFGWQACRQATYDGVIIAPANWHFHPGTLSVGPADPVQGVDSFFPTGTPHNNTAYITVLLPEGIGASDDPPNKLKTVCDTQLVMDYGVAFGAAVELAPVYSLNPALHIADAVIRKGVLGIDGLWWDEWLAAKNWCAAVQADTFPRIELGQAWSTPSDLDNMLNTLCYSSGLDWYYKADGQGRLRIALVTPDDKPSRHHFTLANTTPGKFRYWRADRRKQINQMTFKFRNLADTNLKEEDPLQADRTALQELEGVHADSEVNLGTMRVSAAGRVGAYRAKLKMDLGLMMQVQDDGGYAMHVTTLDRVQITEDTAEWVAKDFSVEQYQDQEQGPDQTLFTCKEWTPGLWDDAARLPSQADIGIGNLPRSSAPPAVVNVALTVYAVALPNNSQATALRGEITFAGFPAPVGQYGKVEWLKPDAGATYQAVGDRRPDAATMKATFDLGPVSPGTHKVKVTVFSDINVRQTAAVVEYTTNVTTAVLTAPPAVDNVALVQSPGHVDGTITAGASTVPQAIRVWLKGPTGGGGAGSAGYAPAPGVPLLFPDSANLATFRLFGLAAGTYYIKAVPELRSDSTVKRDLATEAAWPLVIAAGTDSGTGAAVYTDNATLNHPTINAPLGLVKADVGGIDQVDNTADAAKPVSGPQAAAIAAAKTVPPLVTGWSTGIAASTTLYFAPGAALNGSGTEVQRQVPMPACTVSQLRIHLGQAEPSTGTMVVTVRKNGAATALTLTVAVSTAIDTTVADLVHTVAFAAGEKLSIEVVNNATGVGPAHCLISVAITA